MEQQAKRKTKRKLSDIDFSSEGSHIALCHKDQGVANEAPYQLVIKANKFSDEFVSKMQRVKIELDLPEFLKLFYDIWDEEKAKELAKMFGWIDYSEMMDGVEDALEGERKVEVVDMSPQDYLRTALQDVDQILALAEEQDLATALAGLTEEQYMALLEDQEAVEKSLKKAKVKATKAKKESKSIANKAVIDDTPQQNASVGDDVGVESSVVTKNKEVTMTKEVHVIEQEVTVEMVEKSAFENLQKSLEEQSVALTKAMETIKQFEQEKKELIAKQRLTDLEAAVSDKDHAAVIFKAVQDAADEDFANVVKALAAISAAVDKSELFVEKGAVIEDKAPVKENSVEKLLKAKYASK